MSGFDDVSWDVARNEFKINWFGPLTINISYAVLHRYVNSCSYSTDHCGGDRP